MSINTDEIKKVFDNFENDNFVDAFASSSNYGYWMKGIYESKEFEKVWQVLGNIFKENK